MNLMMQLGYFQIVVPNRCMQRCWKKVHCFSDLDNLWDLLALGFVLIAHICCSTMHHMSPGAQLKS